MQHQSEGGVSEGEAQYVQEQSVTRTGSYRNLLSFQIPKPIDARELERLVDFVCNRIQVHFSAGLSRAPKDAALQVNFTFLSVSVLGPSRGAKGTIDEIENQLLMSAVQSKGSPGILSW